MSRLCRVLGVSTSGYYAWRKRPLSAHRQYDLKLQTVLRAVHQGHRRCYGAARLHRELVRNGHSCSRRRVNRLMREMGIKATTTGLYAWRPGRDVLYSGAGNQLRQAPSPTGANQQWVGDFTYIKTGTGWLYHAVVLDLYNRRVVGWSFSRRRNADLTRSALRMALSRHQPPPGCLFHSDQGIEYAAHEYRELVESAGLVRSMSRKGSPLDNAVVESFFHTLKAELIRKHRFEHVIEAVAKIVEYIEFYNRERLHSSLGYQTPDEYGRACA